VTLCRRTLDGECRLLEWSLLARLQDVRRVEDWGEKHTKKRPPTVFLLDIETRVVVQLPGQKDDTSYGQPNWAPGGELIMVRLCTV
jgi:hypothetical protein